eukprot:jgi/Chrzof1/5145/Cz15g13070.t1
MQHSVESKGVTIRPRYAFKRVEKSPGVFEVQPVEVPGITPSFHQYHVEQVAADIKESLCRVSDNLFDEKENTNIPNITYELPDGTEIQVGTDRFKVPEVLFQPQLVKTFPGMESVPGVTDQQLQSLPGLLLDSINRCDVDIRREMYNGVVLSGGTSLFTGLRDRLEKDLFDLAPQGTKVKVTSPVNPTERRFSVWIGGSILASLGSFQQMWMSKQEFEEHGASLIHRKAP